MSWDVKHMINIIMCTCAFFQICCMKVQQKKMVEDQVYGTPTLMNIQVSFFFSLQQYETWKYELQVKYYAILWWNLILENINSSLLHFIPFTIKILFRFINVKTIM